jgi:hypothetical protein
MRIDISRKNWEARHEYRNQADTNDNPGSPNMQLHAFHIDIEPPPADTSEAIILGGENTVIGSNQNYASPSITPSASAKIEKNDEREFQAKTTSDNKEADEPQDLGELLNTKIPGELPDPMESTSDNKEADEPQDPGELQDAKTPGELLQDAKTPGELPDSTKNNDLEDIILENFGQKGDKIQHKGATVITKRTNYGLKSSAAQFIRLATDDNSKYCQDQDDKDNDPPTLINKDAFSDDEDSAKTEDNVPVLNHNNASTEDEGSIGSEDSNTIDPDMPALEYCFNSDDDDDMSARVPTANNRRLYVSTDSNPQESRNNVVLHNYPDDDILSLQHDGPNERDQQLRYGSLRRGNPRYVHNIGLLTPRGITTNQGLLDMGNPRHYAIARSIYDENERIRNTFQGGITRAHPTDMPYRARFTVNVPRLPEWTSTYPGNGYNTNPINQDEDASTIEDDDQDEEPTSFEDNHQDSNNMQNDGE